jgi:hypothetical protein
MSKGCEVYWNMGNTPISINGKIYYKSILSEFNDTTGYLRFENNQLIVHKGHHKCPNEEVVVDFSLNKNEDWETKCIGAIAYSKIVFIKKYHDIWLKDDVFVFDVYPESTHPHFNNVVRFSISKEYGFLEFIRSLNGRRPEDLEAETCSCSYHPK